ncbi:MAG: hypothetical protein ACR2HI_05490, partial [Gaiella sp.]
GVGFVGRAGIHQVTAADEFLKVCYGGVSVAANVVLAATVGRFVSPPGLELTGPLEVGADMAVPGHEGVYLVGDLVLVPHALYGSIRFPHWDAAIGTGEQAADAIAGGAGSYERLPYWWSDVGPRRFAEVGWAGAAATWNDEDGFHVGRDSGGRAVAVLVVDEPRRLREARALVHSST